MPCSTANRLRQPRETVSNGTQKTPVVREAWLNRTGTLLAVVSAESTPREERAKVVRTVMQNENVSVKELQGAAYERALDDSLNAVIVQKR
jgi:hypothetical protein